MATLFSAVVKPSKPLLYICDETTLITNIAVSPAESSKTQASIQPFVTILKLQYEGPVIEGEKDSDDEDSKPEKKSPATKKPKKSEGSDVEEEEDDSEDSDYSGLEVEAKEAVVGCFTPNNLQITTDILLAPNDQYRFVLSGSEDYEVHLLGRYLEHSGDETPDEYDSEDSDDEDLDDFDLDEMMGEEEEDDESVEGRIQEIGSDDDQVVQEKKKQGSRAKAILPGNSSKGNEGQKKPEEKNSKKRPLEDKSDAAGDISLADSVMSEIQSDGEKLSKSQRKKLKKMKAAESADAKAESGKKEEKHDSNGKSTAQAPVTLPSGLKILDTKVGQGSEAKPGQRISMRYIGKLTNGKVFDSNTSGKPFAFRLGKGEVIKGWDEGIKGMKLGGERRLTIPANLAYGKRGSPPEIPPNSTLVFDVKLLAVK